MAYSMHIWTNQMKWNRFNYNFKALRISWLKRLIQGEGDWQELFKNTVTADYKLIWELDTESMQVFAGKITNKFWYEVFNSWESYIKVVVSLLGPLGISYFGSI